MGSPQQPDEIYAVEGAEPRAAVASERRLARARFSSRRVEEHEASRARTAPRSTACSSKPPDYASGKRYPAMLRIHGGPVDQFQRRLRLRLADPRGQRLRRPRREPARQLGPRREVLARRSGPTGATRTSRTCSAAVDDAVRRGIADPDRLGVGGWSYGGILTNYVIARTRASRRRPAAPASRTSSRATARTSTSASTRWSSGTPWKNPEAWAKVSFPFLHADRIKTPTLFLGGESDFNVPLLNSEQMYQALRSLGVADAARHLSGAVPRPAQAVVPARSATSATSPWYDKWVKPGKKAEGARAGS